MIKLAYIILALGLLYSCNSGTSKNNRTKQSGSTQAARNFLIEQAENRGFQKG